MVDPDTVVLEEQSVSREQVNFAPGDMLGRYIVEGVLGEGGMGVVYEVTDPELSRRIAVKVLRAHAKDELNWDRHLRVEARRLASLSHPNVVAVHDLGRHENRLFIAMELVRGVTLRRFIKRQRSLGPAGRDAIAAAFLDAGRGLAAAHDAHLVHRDFKAENVMVGSDGRVLVMDFGLAKAIDPRGSDTSHGKGLDGGTPGYMSPEQMIGGVVSARSDQFSFCVALFEALYGHRPFTGVSSRALVAQVMSGEVKPNENRLRVPARVLKVLRRGLSFHPSDRYPSMSELLDELAPARAWRRVLALGIGLALCAAGASWALGRASNSLCAEPHSYVQDLWTPVDEQELIARFPLRGGGLPTPHAVGDRVGRALDEWTDAFAAVCSSEGSEARAVGERGDPRLHCLLGQLSEIRVQLGVIKSWQQPRPDAVLELLDGLDSPAACEGAISGPAFAGELGPKEQFRERAAVALARVEALQATGQFKQGLLEARSLLDEARVRGDEDVLAQALYRSAVLQSELGDRRGASELLSEALPLAFAERRQDVVADISLFQANLAGLFLGQPEQAKVHLEVSRAALAELGKDPVRRARVLQVEAQLAHQAAQFDEAEELMGRAIALLSELDGPGSGKVARVQGDLAIVHMAKKNLGAALEAFGAAELTYMEQYGPTHPQLVSIWANRGMAELGAGQLDAARDDLEKAVELASNSLSVQHRSAAAARFALAQLLLNDGAPGAVVRANGLLLEALSGLEAAFGAESAVTAQAREVANGAQSKLRSLHPGDLDVDAAAERERILREVNNVKVGAE